MLTQIAAGIFMSVIALAVFILILKLIRDTLQTMKNQKKSKD
jgi:hypothetical protein|tara:strand:+ start:1339 stop:1464 length:126 start_codon:yes stop_codon:yes gene_type:complete